jgi:IMP dehydrogenase
MRFLNDLAPTFDLTYEDVFMVPSRSSVSSRTEVDLSSVDGTGTTIPIVVANMTAIAGRRMAETVARRGGIVVIPQDIPVDVVASVISFVKSRHLVHDTPITLSASTTAGEGLVLLAKRAHGAAVVVEGSRPIGRVTEHDLSGVDRFTQVQDVMSSDVVALPDGLGPEQSYTELSRTRHRLAPVVDDAGDLVGILTRKGALRSGLYSPAVDASGRLRVAAAVGINGDVAAKAGQVLEAGADVLGIDTAHGHQDNMLDALRAGRSINPSVPVEA